MKGVGLDRCKAGDTEWHEEKAVSAKAGENTVNSPPLGFAGAGVVEHRLDLLALPFRHDASQPHIQRLAPAALAAMNGDCVLARREQSGLFFRERQVSIARRGVG